MPPVSEAQLYENSKQKAYDEKVSDYSSRVERMFADHPVLGKINNEETRAPVVNFLIDNTNFGVIEEEWHGDESDIERWLTIQMEKRANGEELQQYEQWALEYAYEHCPDWFSDPVYRLIENLRKYVDMHGNSRLRHALVDIDDWELNELMSEHDLVDVNLVIDYPLARANFIFATNQEKYDNCYSINILANAAQTDRIAERLLNEPKFATEAHDNALSLFLEQQNASLAEAMSFSCETRPLTPREDFLKSVRTEMENIGDTPVALTILSELSPDIIYDILTSQSVAIDRNATIGLYDAWNGAGSVLGIKPVKDDVFMPVSLISEIEIEGANNSMTVYHTYQMRGNAWIEALSPSDRVIQPDPAMREKGIAAFAKLVSERMNERDENDARPGF